MSDLKDRVGTMTGGNANLITDRGVLLVSDGEQTIYLRAVLDGSADGQVPTVDSGAESGFSFQAGGGGGGVTNVTGADGITVSTPSLGVRQVHNDLVTGTIVANVLAEAHSAVTILGDADGDGSAVNIQNATSGAELNLLETGNVVSLSHSAREFLITDAGAISMAQGANKVEITPTNTINIHNTGAADVSIVAGRNVTTFSNQDTVLETTNDFTIVNDTSAAELDLHADGNVRLLQGSQHFSIDPGGNLEVSSSVNTHVEATGTGSLTVETNTGILTIRTVGPGTPGALTVSGGTDTTVSSGQDTFITPTRDEVHTVGRNFTVGSAGSTGIVLEATHATGKVQLDSDNNDVTLTAGNIGGTGNVGIQIGTTSATRTFAIWDGTPTGQQTVAPPTGGAVIDAESRTAINAIINTLITWGWYAAAP